MAHNLALKIDRKYTYKDYMTWNDDKFWELIDGIPYQMAPPSTKHQRVLGMLFNQFQNYLMGKKCEVFVAPFGVRLPLENEEDEYIKNAILPDIAVVCDKKNLDDAGYRGAPDLIIEILSPSTSKRDVKDKFKLYERAGVKDYWIVDPVHNFIKVYISGKDGTYGKSEVYFKGEKIKVGIFPDLEIDLETVFK